MSGLINYYGRTPEADNIVVKPVLLQKGNTKLALYGMSNVRDERLFRTFRDGNVKFFQPSTQKDDWYNIMSVHQNHHAYTDTGYLPENFLPYWMDLVVWGHEHECLIDSRTNPETSFKVMQPGSSVATSLVPGEAVTKQVAILSVTGKEMKQETIRLKTVRPFIHKEIALQDNREMRDISKDDNNKPKITRFLMETMEGLIEEAKQSWLEAQREADEEFDEESADMPLPLIRLRVEYTAPEGGDFDCENPQRFSNRFVGKVANVNDVIQFHRKKKSAKRSTNDKPDMPEESIMAQLSINSIKVDRLVKEFLTAQSLTILPQNTFGDAVIQFVDKDDKMAMGQFVDEALELQLKQLTAGDEDMDEDELAEKIEAIKSHLEESFAKGQFRLKKRKGSRKPKPDAWDSDLDGHWEDDPASIIREEDEDAMAVDEDDEDAQNVASRTPAPRGRGRGRGGKAAAGTTRKTAATAKKAPAKAANGRGKQKQQVSDNEDEEEEPDAIMIDDDDDEEDEELFVRPAKKAPAAKAAPAKKAPAKTPAKSTASRSAAAKKPSPGQGQLSFASQSNGTNSKTNGRAAASKVPPRRMQEPSEDEISDDDAFEPPPPSTRSTKRR